MVTGYYTEAAWKGWSGERWDAFSPVVSGSRGSSLSMVPGASWGLLSASCHLSAASLRSTPVHSPRSQTLCSLLSHRQIWRRVVIFLSLQALGRVGFGENWACMDLTPTLEEICTSQNHQGEWHSSIPRSPVKRMSICLQLYDLGATFISSATFHDLMQTL